MINRRLFANTLVASAASTFLPSFAFADESVLDRVKRTKIMRYGVVNGQPPYCYKDPASGKWQGFLISLSNGLSASLGATAQPVESNWGNAVLDIQSNKVDVFFGLGPTPQRAKVVDFTSPLYRNAFSLIARKDFNAKTWDDLNKPSVKIAIETGTVYDQNIAHLCPNATILRLPSNNDALLAVQSGRADCQIVVVIFALTDLGKNPDLGHLIVPQPLFGATTNGIVAKGSSQDWLNYVNTWLEAQHKSGAVQQMLVTSLNQVGVPTADIPSKLLF